MNLISIFVSSIIAENVILTKFLGVCPFMGTSDKEKSAIGMGLAVSIVMLLSSVITYLIYHYLLVPTDTTYLMTIMFILVIACVVQIMILIMKKMHSHLYDLLGIYLPLITTNCAILGITLLNINNEFNFIQTVVYSIGSSIGFTLVIYLFAVIRENLDDVIDSFKGYPIAFIIAGIMALIFGRII